MPIEFGSPQAERTLRRKYLKENKMHVITALDSIYKSIKRNEAAIKKLQDEIESHKAEAAKLRNTHNITVEDELMFLM